MAKLRRKLDRACSKRTICEVHRQMYDIITVKVADEKVRHELRALTEEAFDMGVKLVTRLVDRKIKMLQWSKCVDKDEVNRLRKERIRLENATTH